MNDYEHQQEIILNNRKNLSINGVKKINSLNEKVFDVDTVLGRMNICGNSLDMQNLDIDKGILLITGVIDKIEYLDKKEKEKKDSSFIAKLFK